MNKIIVKKNYKDEELLFDDFNVDIDKGTITFVKGKNEILVICMDEIYDLVDYRYC